MACRTLSVIGRSTPLAGLWSPAKALINLKKHGVSFDEARSVFFDDFAVQFFDETPAAGEDRFILLGMSSGPRLLVEGSVLLPR